MLHRIKKFAKECEQDWAARALPGSRRSDQATPPPPAPGDAGPSLAVADADGPLARAAQARVLGRYADDDGPAQWGVGPARGSPGAVVVREHYNYVPSVLFEQGTYRMWWCGGVAGDFILYAEAKNLAGPWRARDGKSPYEYALQPTQNHQQDSFDAEHTCDPSTLRIGNDILMYYGGLGYHGDNRSTSIGVALSQDGVNFKRLNGGQPIVRRARDLPTYGAGQPSVFFHAELFYMAYHDSTGYAANITNQAGIYALRSPDCTFQDQVEELTADGWASRTDTNHTRYAITEAFSVDWTFIESEQVIAMAVNQGLQTCGVRFWHLDGRPAGNSISFNTPTQEKFGEGPGIVRGPRGQALMVDDQTVCFNVMQAIEDHSGKQAPWCWDLGWYGVDLTPTRDLSNCLITCKDMPVALVTPAGRIQFDSWDLANPFKKRTVPVAIGKYYSIAYLGSVHQATKLLSASGRSLAYVDQDARVIFPLDIPMPSQAAGVEEISTQAYDAYRVGARLHGQGG